MDDREIVAAIGAGALPGLAAAYDDHAESLYGYCRWMLREPEDAADAVEDTFIVTAGPLQRPGDQRRVRPRPQAGCPTPGPSGGEPSRSTGRGWSVPPWTS